MSNFAPETLLREPSGATNSPGFVQNSRRPSVVVVGAGFAGIAAAGALREGGLGDVLVLEAQDRAGGRVQKVQLDDGFLETGAQFIHGERGNSLYELAAKYGLLQDQALCQTDEKTSDSSAEDYRNHHFFTSEGRQLPSDRVAPLLRAANQVLRDYANSFFVERERKQQQVSTVDLNSLTDDFSKLRHVSNHSDTTEQSNNTSEYSNRQPFDHNASQKKESGESGDCQFLDVKCNELENRCNYIIKYGGSDREDDGKEEVTFAQVLKKTREEILKVGNEPENIKMAVLKWMEQWEYTDNAARLDELSLQAYGKYGYVPGYGMTLSSSGLEDVFTAFLHESLRPEDSILLNTPVKTIFWEQGSPPEQDAEEAGKFDKTCRPSSCQVEQGIRILSEHGDNVEDNSTRNVINHVTPNNVTPKNDGTLTECPQPVKVVCENGEEYFADHVIVTSSMGYLQKNEASLFKPALPVELRGAVLGMGFGVVAKVFLVWDDLGQVMDKDVEGLQLLWVEGHPVKPPSDRTASKTKAGGNWYDDLQGFERVESHNGALMTWLAGEEAEIMAALPEGEVKDVLHELMVHFLAKPLLPPPKQVVRSLWNTNPYILGGYSYIPQHMDPDLHDLLSCPLPSPQNPILQLCGEATSRRFYSTVHGAIDSGRQAAYVILRHHQRRHQNTSSSHLGL